MANYFAILSWPQCGCYNECLLSVHYAVVFYRNHFFLVESWESLFVFHFSTCLPGLISMRPLGVFYLWFKYNNSKRTAHLTTELKGFRVRSAFLCWPLIRCAGAKPVTSMGLIRATQISRLDGGDWAFWSDYSSGSVALDWALSQANYP